MIKTKLTELIGNTPIIKYEGVYIKLEGFNLGGSIKDRIALNMINT
ncbi:MAG: cysteine synthase A, partial [Bacilli bacterium]